MSGLEVFVYENHGQREIAIHGARCSWSLNDAAKLHTKLDEVLRRAFDPTPLPPLPPPAPRLPPFRHTPTPTSAEDLA